MRCALQVPEDVRDALIAEITRVVSSTSQSNLPAIYGMAAAADVKRLRPKSSETAADILQVRLRRP